MADHRGRSLPDSERKRETGDSAAVPNPRSPSAQSPPTSFVQSQRHPFLSSVPLQRQRRSTPPPPQEPRAKRGADALKVFPVLFVILLVICIYTIFLVFHCLPLLQPGIPPERRNLPVYYRGIIQLVVYHVIFTMFLISYILVVITPAGTIPLTEEWVQDNADAEHATSYLERKDDGGRRYCKWCDKYKPDRAHHCRQCQLCILKMDHHCPWIYNCVGWGNHKYFLLTLLYATLSTLFVAFFQLESVRAAIEASQIRFGVLFLLLFGESLAAFLGLLCFGFFAFHMWLVTSNLSTIEFCEKRFRKPTKINVYNKGCCRNLGEAFGFNPLLWLVPVDNRPGDGLHFTISKKARHLLEDAEQQPILEPSRTPSAIAENG